MNGLETLEIGIDVGGTFTDVVGRLGDRVWLCKVPTTPGDLVGGINAGIRQVLHLADLPAAAIGRFVHGTTVATNAVIEQRAKPVAFFATEGFEDIIEIGRQRRTRMYDLNLEPETPSFLCPREYRFAIEERIGADGSVVKTLNERSVVAAIERATELGVEAVAVCLLFSWLDPTHEHKVRDIVRRLAPQLEVSISSDVDPVFREAERATSTAFDAYVKPVVRDYLGRLEKLLRELSVPCELEFMQSRGSVAGWRAAADNPVTTLLSGPAAGVIGAKQLAERLGRKRIITVDIGGTSSDVGLFAPGQEDRFAEGRILDFPLRIPMLAISTVGAGGGSIAAVDAAGSLRVGPHSVGAQPGPACYGRGGDTATVTDAALLLGLLPDRLNGIGQLNRDLAEAAIRRSVAEPMGMSPVEAAVGIIRVAVANVANQIRLVSVKRGWDPSSFSLVAYGGLGPLFGAYLLRELELEEVLVFPACGVLSALGLLLAERACESSAGVNLAATPSNSAQLEQLLSSLDAAATAEVSGHTRGPITVTRVLDMHYVGQSHDLRVPLPAGDASAEAASAAFRSAYRQLYGYADESAAIEIVGLHSVAAIQSPEFSVSPEEASRSAQSSRAAIVGSTLDVQAVPVLGRSQVEPDSVLAGPLIVEQADTTIVVLQGQSLREHGGALSIVANPKANETRTKEVSYVG